MEKVGLGIITCNREDFYKQCYKSVPYSFIDELVTVNDGKKYKGRYPKTKLIQHKKNKSVGISKNDAIKHLLEKGCTHIFLIEDDILIKDPVVFVKYIEAAQETGLQHLMFGYHGPANKGMQSKGAPKPRVIIEYKNNVRIALNQHCVGAFCYFHKDVIDKVGMFDETYKNVWEHVDHSYSIVNAGLLPGYWYWPDIANSYDYLDEQACSEEHEKGVIRKKDDWEDNMIAGAKHFYSKYQVFPGSVPEPDPQSVVKALKIIKERYNETLCTTSET